MASESTSRTWRDALAVYGTAGFVMLAGFFVAFKFVDPAPPERIAIGAGATSGAYYLAARSYARVLAEHGVAVDVVETAGSIENLDRLTRTGNGAVDVALIQGGVKGDGGKDGASELESLASVYYEPIWVFHGRRAPIARLSDLLGRRVAAGPEGSGTRSLVLKLLAANGITSENTNIEPMAARRAAQALVAREIDCLVLVAGATSPLVRELLADPRLVLMDIGRAEAYVRRNRYLSALELPEGTIDLAANVPPTDVSMIAATANLVARPDLHPALVDLLLIAAGEIHRAGGVFEAPGEFPSSRHIDFPLNKEAGRYFEHGPPFLIRTLPFWAATLVDRLKVMLLPLVALALPLVRILPPVYRWRVRSRIYRWYHDLGQIETALHDRPPGTSARGLLAELERIETEVRQVSVPGPYEEEHYHLRVHIEFVRERIDRMLGPASATGAGAATGP